MLNFTGDLFVDVGACAITVFTKGVNHPSQLKEEHLSKIADYIRNNYPKPPLKNYLTMAFTKNAWFTQNGYNPDLPNLTKEKQEERRQKRDLWANRHVQQWQVNPEKLFQRGAFIDEPSIEVSLTNSLPKGRAGRGQIPLLSGDSVINFYPNGQKGLPVSGKSLLCIHAFPLAAAQCGMDLLIVHSDNEQIMLEFAQEFWRSNQRKIQMARLDKTIKMAQDFRPRTLLIRTLQEILKVQEKAQKSKQLFSVTAYLISNGRDPTLKINPLRKEVVLFIKEVNRDPLRHEWRLIEQSSEVIKRSKGKGLNYNYLFENLFDLPREAKRFFRNHLLRVTWQLIRHGKTDHDLSLLWKITQLFLWRIMYMQPERIEKIRQLADSLADYVYNNPSKGKKFFKEFCNVKYAHFRMNLIRVLYDSATKKELAFKSDDFAEIFVTVFEFAEYAPHKDWRLARDLIFMRMVELLHNRKWDGFSGEEIIPETHGDDEEVNQ